MATTKYVGPLGDKTFLVKKSLSGLDVQVVTQSQITSAIDEALSDKVTHSEVNSKATLYEDESNLSSYVTNAIDKTTVGKPNGPIPLSGGKIPNSYTPNITGGVPWRFLGSTPNWSLGSFTGTIDGSPKTLATWTLPNIGYPYLPIFTGSVRMGNSNGVELQVRQGSRTGKTVARAISGNASFYEGSAIFPSGDLTSVTSGTFYVVIGKKFSGGSAGNVADPYTLSCWAVPV